MKRNIIIILAVALLLAPWPIAYAWEGVNADTANASSITPADPTNAPQIKAYGNAIGSVSPGDLFQIDTTGIQTDTEYTLTITNLDEIASDYRYMNLKIGVSVQSDNGTGAWKKLDELNGEQFHDLYITMFGDKVEFTLPGGARYKVTVDTGCCYCYAVKPGESIAVPTFYLATG